MAEVLQQVSDALVAMVEAASPGVVRVEGRRRFPATGIVWSAEGLIVTAHHVVEQHDALHVGLPQGQQVKGTLVGRDPTTDLALLQVQATGLTPPRWAEHEGQEGPRLRASVGRARCRDRRECHRVGRATGDAPISRGIASGQPARASRIFWGAARRRARTSGRSQYDDGWAGRGPGDSAPGDQGVLASGAEVCLTPGDVLSLFRDPSTREQNAVASTTPVPHGQSWNLWSQAILTVAFEGFAR